MKLFYIKSKVSIKVFGISGVSQEGVSSLVKAEHIDIAKRKFEAHCQKKFAHMMPEGLHFEYIEVAQEIE